MTQSWEIKFASTVETFHSRRILMEARGWRRDMKYFWAFFLFFISPLFLSFLLKIQMGLGSDKKKMWNSNDITTIARHSNCLCQGGALLGWKFPQFFLPLLCRLWILFLSLHCTPKRIQFVLTFLCLFFPSSHNMKFLWSVFRGKWG